MSNKIRGFEIVDEKHREVPTTKNHAVLMPCRGSKHSAGYDFHATHDLELLPGEKVFFWTDIKAYMLDDEVLKLYPRSSFGIKKDLKLKNTVGIIDSDYYSNADNDGNIGICLWNFGDRTRYIKKGEATAQGIFEKFLEADNCNTEETRTGGIGSTDKN